MSNQPIQQRPGLVTAAAVINFIYGGLGVVAMLCCGGGLALVYFTLQKNPPPPPPPGGPDPFAELVETGEVLQAVPGFVAFNVAYFVLEFVMLVGLVVSGFGLLKLRRWARTYCLIFAAYVLLGNASAIVYYSVVVQPTIPKLLAEHREQKKAKAAPGAPAPPPNSTLNSMNSSMGGSLIEIAYAIALAVVLNLPDVRRAFRQGWVTGSDEPPAPGRERDPSDRFYEDQQRDRFRSGDDRIEPGDR